MKRREMTKGLLGMMLAAGASNEVRASADSVPWQVFA